MIGSRVLFTLLVLALATFGAVACADPAEDDVPTESSEANLSEDDEKPAKKKNKKKSDPYGGYSGHAEACAGCYDAGAR